jgi:hypothetical protein
VIIRMQLSPMTDGGSASDVVVASTMISQIIRIFQSLIISVLDVFSMPNQSPKSTPFGCR